MNFVKALRAFMQVCFGGGECEHAHVNLIDGPSFCPDCGYQVKIGWMFTICRQCHAKRTPQKTVLGEVKPLQQFCRHCGHDRYMIIKKDRIEAYELIYAISAKTVVYGDSPNYEPIIENPFRTTVTVESGDVFEAEIIRRTEYRGTKSAFKTAPFEWQRQQSPKRYGATYRSQSESNVLPLRKLS